MKPIFIDCVEIEVKAGNGGNGCRSFYRRRGIRFPRADGGDGGKGGDVVLIADGNIHTLLDLQYRKHFVAENGGHGKGNHKKGENAPDCLIRVPAGTLVKDRDTGRVLRDLARTRERVIVVRGGEGGKGNKPRRDATKGKPGEEKRLLLELKLVADVALVGYPNAGKSTLLNRISRARSKVADYPFTTRVPVLGRVETEDREMLFTPLEIRGDKACLRPAKAWLSLTGFTVADMPGLIEGAHKGKGLGLEFLRHIERTKILVHLVDISQPKGRDAYSDYLNLNKELFLYNPGLKEKFQIVAANKIDLSGSSENLKKFSEKLKSKVYPISALRGEGIEDLLEAIGNALA